MNKWKWINKYVSGEWFETFKNPVWWILYMFFAVSWYKGVIAKEALKLILEYGILAAIGAAGYQYNKRMENAKFFLVEMERYFAQIQELTITVDRVNWVLASRLTVEATEFEAAMYDKLSDAQQRVYDMRKANARVKIGPQIATRSPIEYYGKSKDEVIVYPLAKHLDNIHDKTFNRIDIEQLKILMGFWGYPEDFRSNDPLDRSVLISDNDLYRRLRQFEEIEAGVHTHKPCATDYVDYRIAKEKRLHQPTGYFERGDSVHFTQNHQVVVADGSPTGLTVYFWPGNEEAEVYHVGPYCEEGKTTKHGKYPDTIVPYDECEILYRLPSGPVIFFKVKKDMIEPILFRM